MTHWGGRAITTSGHRAASTTTGANAERFSPTSFSARCRAAVHGEYASTGIPPRQSWDPETRRRYRMGAKVECSDTNQRSTYTPLFVPIMVADDCLRRTPVWQRQGTSAIECLSDNGWPTLQRIRLTRHRARSAPPLHPSPFARVERHQRNLRQDVQA